MDFRQDIRLYTSYFGNIKRVLRACPDACLVSIAGKTPDWFTGTRCRRLAPHYDWWKEWHDKFEGRLECNESKDWYAVKYNETVLSKLDKSFIDELCLMSEGRHPVFLLCYETPEKFCHRHLVSAWLKQNNTQCIEWNDSNEDQK